MIELDIHLPLDRFALSIQTAIESDAAVLLGPSGSGKTSLLEVIAGLRPRATGRVAVDGEILLDTAAGRRLPPERRRIGYVPQDAGLFPHLDVRANVRFGLRSSPGAERRFAEAVAMLEIEPLLARYPPSTLSGGERQRVALARALASEPRLLLLDEPLGGLDPALRGRVLPYLRHIRDAAGIPIVFVTHHLGDALALAREALVLENGALAAHGPAATVLTSGRILALDPEVVLDNVIEGRIVARDDAGGIARLEAAPGFTLAVPAAPDLAAGVHATYSVSAEDILLSAHPLPGVSARNVLQASIAAITPIGGDILVRLAAGGMELRARVTPVAARELALAAGRPIWVAIKTHALRRLG